MAQKRYQVLAVFVYALSVASSCWSQPSLVDQVTGPPATLEQQLVESEGAGVDIYKTLYEQKFEISGQRI